MDNSDIMAESSTKYLGIIAKGAVIVLIGTVIGLMLNFMTRILLARFTTQAEYGSYNLALVITTICITISTLGLEDGSARYIAYFKGKEKNSRINDIALTSIKISIISGILMSAVLFIFSEYISMSVYHSKDLIPIIKLFIVTIPFTVLMNVLVAIQRGFGNARLKVYFQDVLRPILNVLFILIVILFSNSIISLTYAYLLSTIITCTFLIIYMDNRMHFSINYKFQFENQMVKELLNFSVPLLGVQVLILVMTWTDTLMIGSMKSFEEVGIYNAAAPLASLISTIMASMSFMYVPIISRLYSNNLITEIKESFIHLTKWTFLITFPLFSALFLYPTYILNLFFGSRYIGAASSLQILSLGIIINVGFGFAHNTLVVIGKSNSLMKSFIVSGFLNVILNLMLIPPMGIQGASIATAVSIVVGKVLNTLQIYHHTKIHPFTKKYLKIIAISVMFILLLSYNSTPISNPMWIDTIIIAAYLLTYIIIIILTKCLSEEDLKMFIILEKKFGLKKSPGKILSKFV